MFQVQDHSVPVANMSSTHKLNPLVINNCLKPHIFSQKSTNVQQLPVDFHTNKKIWMTSNVFGSWLYKQDRHFTRQERKVALILDKCTAHSNINSTVKSIKFIFLPPTTTSITQPMDQGIIASFHSHYRCYFVQHGLLKAMEAGRDFNKTVLDAVCGVEAAWSKVTPATIKNCYSHFGFVVPVSAATPEDDDDPEDDIPLPS